MRRHTMLILAAVTCAATGCNQPAVSLKPPAFQSSENTVRDWNDVAHRIAAELNVRGLVTAGGQPQSPGMTSLKPLFIRIEAPGSAFIREVAEELQSDITRMGGAVALGPDDATVVNLDVDFVHWGPRDKPPGLAGFTGAMLGTSGVIAGASLPMNTWTAADAASAGFFGAGILADLAIALTPTMNAEAIWQATVVSRDRMMMKLQGPVYVRAADIPLYAKDITLAPVPSWSPDKVLPTRQIRYTP